MAADPLNSVGGYSVGIPPIRVFDGNANLVANTANIVTLNVGGNLIANGHITANYFVGDVIGNIQGTLVSPGFDTEILYNDNGNAGASPNFTFDSTKNLVTIDGDLVANSITVGAGTTQFSTMGVLFATTVSSATNQILHTTVANTICSIDYTIIATDVTSNTRQTSKLFASVLGSEVGYFEYGTIDVPFSSPGVGDFKVVYDTGNVKLTVSPVTSHTTNYRIMITSYKA
jgi:hypothetical protein